MENKSLIITQFLESSSGIAKYVALAVFKLPKLVSLPILLVFFLYIIPIFIKADNICNKCLSSSDLIKLKSSNTSTSIKHKRIDGKADRRYKDNVSSTTTYKYQCSCCGNVETIYSERPLRTILLVYTIYLYGFKNS